MASERSHLDNPAIPELNGKPIDESDNDAPGITPSNVSSMPRAEDDDATSANSPEFHERKAPEKASPKEEKHQRSSE